MTESIYTDEFHDVMGAAALVSAAEIVPLILAMTGPLRSVVDLGCGTGAWLSMFASQGIERILGMDGDYVDRSQLMIPAESFVPTDLSAPIALDERFDLAMSVEVAEHLPPGRAEGFIDDLVRLAPVVMFSAAVPGQRGLGHVNEHWQHYWSRLFIARGYAPIDVVRRRVWTNPKVSWWYRQNLLVYASRDALDARPRLTTARKRTYDDQISMVHPIMYYTLHRDYLRLVDEYKKARAEIRRLRPRRILGGADSGSGGDDAG